MNLDKRQKILVGCLAGFLFLWQGSGVLWGIVFGPFDQRSSQIASLDVELKKKQDAKFQLDITERRTRQWERRSLPPNADVASPLYHHWVLDLANKHRLAKLTVTPKRLSSAISNQVFTRIPVSVTAECKMDQLCQFLYDFYRTDLLHKVTHLGIESLDFKANPLLKVSLELEGLSLKSAPSRTTLFAGKQETSVSDAMSKKSLADYKSLTASNRFVRGYNGPPKPPAPPVKAAPPGPPPTPFDSSPHVILAGYSQVDDLPPQAWFYDRTINQDTVLKPGTDFEIAGVKGKVLEIHPRFVKLKIKDKDWRLEVGDSLKQMTEIKPEAPASTTPASTPAAELPSKPPA